MHSPSYRKALVDLLVQIERRYDVNRFTHQDVCIWPIIRSRIAQAIEDAELASGRFQVDFKKVAEGFQETFEKSFPQSKSNVISSASNLDLKDDFQCDALFFGRSERHSIDRDGYFYDGQLDYLFEDLSKQVACLKIEEFAEHTPKHMPRSIPVSFFKTPWHGSRSVLINEFSNKGFSRYLSLELNGFLDMVWKDFGLTASRPKVKNIENTFLCVEAYARFFMPLLERINPKEIYFELFYNPPTWGVMLAANRLGIPTIEVQHGLIGKHHWFSTHWSSIPEGGYPLLPDFFWVFDEETKEAVEKYQDPEEIQPKAWVGGIPKINHLQNNSVQKKAELRSSEVMFISSLKQYKVVVLVALNYHMFAPEVLLSAMKNSPKDWFWLLRMHPMTLPASDILENMYRTEGFINFEIQYSSRIPVYELIANSHHLVTSYSTLALEAYLLGLDVTLSDYIGKEQYIDYVNDQRMYYADTGEQLVATIEKSFDKKLHTNSTSEPISAPVVEGFAAIKEAWSGISTLVKKRQDGIASSQIFTSGALMQASKMFSGGMTNARKSKFAISNNRWISQSPGNGVPISLVIRGFLSDMTFNNAAAKFSTVPGWLYKRYFQNSHNFDFWKNEIFGKLGNSFKLQFGNIKSILHFQRQSNIDVFIDCELQSKAILGFVEFLVEHIKKINASNVHLRITNAYDSQIEFDGEDFLISSLHIALSEQTKTSIALNQSKAKVSHRNLLSRIRDIWQDRETYSLRDIFAVENAFPLRGGRFLSSPEENCSLLKSTGIKWDRIILCVETLNVDGLDELEQKVFEVASEKGYKFFSLSSSANQTSEFEHLRQAADVNLELKIALIQLAGFYVTRDRDSDVLAMTVTGVNSVTLDELYEKLSRKKNKL